MKNKGFTLIEMLVVLAVLSIASGLILTIFTRTLQGNNKSQVISAIKQNGQSVLEIMDKTIRNADRVVCVTDQTTVVVKNGNYTRFRFVPPSSTNGYIQQETLALPSPPPSDPNSKLYVRDYESSVCTDPSASSAQIITDTNTQSGISVTDGKFTQDKVAGFKDQVVVKFTLKPGVGAPSSLAGKIDDVFFQTTINLR